MEGLNRRFLAQEYLESVQDACARGRGGQNPWILALAVFAPGEQLRLAHLPPTLKSKFPLTPYFPELPRTCLDLPTLAASSLEIKSSCQCLFAWTCLGLSRLAMRCGICKLLANCLRSTHRYHYDIMIYIMWSPWDSMDRGLWESISFFGVGRGRSQILVSDWILFLRFPDSISVNYFSYSSNWIDFEKWEIKFPDGKLN